MTDKIEAVLRAHSGAYEPYYGDLRPDMGVAIWDAGEGVWAVRLHESDEVFSCGMECCGLARAAVVAVRITIENEQPSGPKEQAPKVVERT